jgi:hypothetical protein
MPEYQIPDGWADRQLWGTGDLAVFLGGSEDSFTGLLLVLITKAQSTPANFSRLSLAFPREVSAWMVWNAMSPVPTSSELRSALEMHAELYGDETPSGPGEMANLTAEWAKREGILGKLSEEQCRDLARAFAAGYAVMADLRGRP